MQENLFKIENAKPEDVEAMRSIVRDNWLVIYLNEKYGINIEDIKNIDWFNPEILEKRRKEIIENKDTVQTFVLKNDENKIVGFCKVSKLDNMGEIDGMYVIQELQGKGLGKKLMEKALEWLGQNTDIKLKVVIYNTRAIEFYKKFGFKETENKITSYPGTKLANGKELPRIEMVK